METILILCKGSQALEHRFKRFRKFIEKAGYHFFCKYTEKEKWIECYDKRWVFINSDNYNELIGRRRDINVWYI